MKITKKQPVKASDEIAVVEVPVVEETVAPEVPVVEEAACACIRRSLKPRTDRQVYSSEYL